MVKISCLDFIITNAENVAKWQRNEALQHPKNAQGHVAIADPLTRLVRDLHERTGGSSHLLLDAMLTRKPDLWQPFTVLVQKAVMAVGFRRSPPFAAVLLEDLARDLQEKIDFGDDPADIGGRPPKEYHAASASLAADRIAIVTEHLRALRINSLADPISELESISKELAESSESDEPELEPLVRKALAVFGGIFDALGSEKGARIVVSGAVAGLVGAIGLSAELAYGLTLAAWMGKDAFLSAVTSLPRRGSEQKS